MGACTSFATSLTLRLVSARLWTTAKLMASDGIAVSTLSRACALDNAKSKLTIASIRGITDFISQSPGKASCKGTSIYAAL